MTGPVVDAERIASILTSNLAATKTVDELGNQDPWHHARRVLLESLLEVGDARLDELIVQARQDIAELTDRVDRIIDARTGQ